MCEHVHVSKLTIRSLPMAIALCTYIILNLKHSHHIHQYTVCFAIQYCASATIGANGEFSAAESVLRACTSVNPLFCTMSSVLSVVTGKVSASSKQALRAVVARACTLYTCSVTTCTWPTLDSPFYWPPIAPCILQNYANLMHNIHVHIYMYENRHLYNLL